jgi:hypothetical protein
MNPYRELLGINFGELKALMGKTGDFGKSILYGRLKHQVNNTKVTRDGKNVIARTREAIAGYNGKGLTETDEDLRDLVTMGAIDCKAGMWNGNKRMFIACNWGYNLGINARKYDVMNRYTGGIKQSVILSYIAYCTAANPLIYQRGRFKGYPSVIISKRKIMELLGVTLRTANAYIEGLAKKAIVQYEGRRLWGEGQYHIQIQPGFYEAFVEAWKEEEEEYRQKQTALKLAKRAKSGVSIRIKKESKEEIINNNTLVDENGTIILSMREQSYLAEAVKRTLARTKGVTWTFATLLAQVRYAMSFKEQRKGTKSFAHAINRAMFLVREGLWKMPFGYEKYSFAGIGERERLNNLENEYMCPEAVRRRDENEQRVKRLEERGMYQRDNDEDYGNVWAAKKLAADLLKREPKVGRSRNEQPRCVITNPIVMDKVQVSVEDGAKEFSSHEDVMAKLLGKV